jgi:NADPH:quinone reductase-like Zn-dependent oxidoreductase
MSTQTMNAIQVHDYGDANQLKLEQIARPEPREGEVRVHVYAAGVNPVDWKFRSGMLKDFVHLTLP